MIYDVKITEQAEADLCGIYEYIAYILQSSQNAAAQLVRLEKNIGSLAQMPERFRRYEKEPWYGLGWRLMLVDRYCVFYMVEHEQGVVSVTRILYGGRDMEAALTNGEEHV